MATPKNMMAAKVVQSANVLVNPNEGISSSAARQNTENTIMPPRTKMRVFLPMTSKTNPPKSAEIKQPIGKAEDVITAIPAVNPNVSFR